MDEINKARIFEFATRVHERGSQADVLQQTYIRAVLEQMNADSKYNRTGIKAHRWALEECMERTHVTSLFILQHLDDNGE